MFDSSTGLNIRDNKAIIKMLWKNDRYPMLLGDRGIGKSQVAFQVADEDMNLPVYYLNCSQVDAESLIYPSIKETERRVDPEALLPHMKEVAKIGEDGKAIVTDRSIDLITIDGLEQPIVVLLDELTNARQSLWSLLLSFVAEKRIGSRYFPNILFIATGNRTDNSSLAQPLPRPLMERFCILDAPVPTKEEWMEYMKKTYTSVPGYYYGFVHNIPSKMFYEKESEGGDVEDMRQLPSPRSHTYAASVLSEYEKVEEARNHMAYIYPVFKGYLGDSVASRFIAYLQDADNFLTYEQYTNGKKPTTAPQVINLAVDAAEKLLPIFEKDDEKYFKAVDELLLDVHRSQFTSLTQFTIDTVTNTTPEDRSTKARLIGWGRFNKKSNIYKIIDERKKMLDETTDAFDDIS